MCVGWFGKEFNYGYCECGCAACQIKCLSKKEHDLKCQSRQQYEKSDEITKNHVAGLFCKESNQCRICSEIKFCSRLLRHIGGVCGKSRKCEACRREKEYPQKSLKYVLVPKLIWSKLYNLMLFPHGRVKCKYL